MSTTEPIVIVDHLVKHFPIMQGIVFQKPVGAVRAVDGISFRSPVAKRWGWWVSRAAARPPPGALCSACIRPPRATSSLTAWMCARRKATRCWPSAAKRR